MQGADYAREWFGGLRKNYPETENQLRVNIKMYAAALYSVGIFACFAEFLIFAGFLADLCASSNLAINVSLSA